MPGYKWSRRLSDVILIIIIIYIIYQGYIKWLDLVTWDCNTRVCWCIVHQDPFIYKYVVVSNIYRRPCYHSHFSSIQVLPVVADWADWTKIINAVYMWEWRQRLTHLLSILVGSLSKKRNVCHTLHMWQIKKIKNSLGLLVKICALQDEESVVCLALICAELNTFDYLLMALNSLWWIAIGVLYPL